MPNGKTHFIAGAVVGATVNFIIQSTERAMDYDKPFDWGEFFLCTGAGAFASLAGKTASLPLPWGEGQGEGEGSVRKTIGQLLAIAGLTNLCQLFHASFSAGLIAYAISGKHTLKLSRTTRLFLWVFGINHLSRIALDSTCPKPANLPASVSSGRSW